MAQKKKQTRLIDWFEINVYEPITNDLIAGTELRNCSFEDTLFKILQMHKRYPNKDIDIFFRPNNFGGMYVESSEE